MSAYTSTLNAGIGMQAETVRLLELWEPGMSAAQLYDLALSSGDFPTMSARRLRNFITESFAPCCLTDEDKPALVLKQLHPRVSKSVFNQLLFLYTCRAHPILGDFVRQLYWPAYMAGREEITNQDARLFVSDANRAGLTTSTWTDNTVQRVASYLTSYCADFGLLESGAKQKRKILPFRLAQPVAIFLAYDLHFGGLGDNTILTHPDWELFGLDRHDVLDELKRLGPQAGLIIQSASGAVRIDWRYRTLEEVLDVIAG